MGPTRKLGRVDSEDEVSTLKGNRKVIIKRSQRWNMTRTNIREMDGVALRCSARSVAFSWFARWSPRAPGVQVETRQGTVEIMDRILLLVSIVTIGASLSRGLG